MPKEPVNFVDLEAMRDEISQRIVDLVDVQRDIEAVLNRGVRYTEIKYHRELERLKAGCKRLKKAAISLEDKSPVNKELVEANWGSLWNYIISSEAAELGKQALSESDFETFATTAYISASEDLLEAAAVPSLCLIIIASFFILLTSKYILRDIDE